MFDELGQGGGVSNIHGMHSGRPEPDQSPSRDQTLARIVAKGDIALTLGIGMRPRRAKTGETLDHFMTYWLENQVAKTKRPGTLASYEQITRKYIRPVIGKVRLIDLTREHVEAVQNHAALTLSGSTVRLVRIVLGAALKRAEMWERPGTRKVVRLTDGPKVGPRQQHFLDPDQARALLIAIKGTGLEMFWMLALFGGLRLGELQGLRWQDLDLGNHQLRLAQSYKTPSRGLEPLKTKS
jgi:integrase